jgi:elongation factor Ts
MAAISATMVKELRERTGAGFMDSKRALEEADGNVDRAVELLRERGHAAAAKKSGRQANEGLIDAYIHTGGRFGALIEVNCETDFVARTEQFRKLVRDLAIQVVALRALYPTIESIPADVLDAKRAELQDEPATAAKPDAIRNQIVQGQLKKWYQQVVLYEQPFRDTEQTVHELVQAAIATIGENIQVRRFVRFEVGEEL